MPHAVLETGPLTSTNEAVAIRTLIPGIQPGGQFAGREMKPALLIQNAFLEALDIDPDQDAIGPESAHVFLKFSQESDLDPGLIVPVGYIGWKTEGAAFGTAPVVVNQEFNAHGSIWVPAYVGLRVFIRGTWTEFEAAVHLDYEQLMIPWMDWFIRWDFLDNISVTNKREY